MRLHFMVWMDQYGYLILFLALMLELIIFGIPTEILMAYAGFLVFQGKMDWTMAILIAGIGSSMGISISYFIGRKLGYSFFNKFGHRIMMGPERLDKFSGWYGKYGFALIVVAYFIPGVRHITGYFSGVTRISFPKFAAFAYLGAFTWVSVYVSLGVALGPQWQIVHHSTKYLILGSVLLALVAVVIFLYKLLKGRVKKGIRVFMTESSLPTRYSIILTALVFMSLFIMAIGIWGEATIDRF